MIRYCLRDPVDSGNLTGVDIVLPKDGLQDLTV